MSDLIDKLWPAFEAEVSEQLEQLEQMLARGSADADIHFLFRQFHTIKSSSAMMDFAGMEAIAHAAEDLLDLVRRGEMLLQPGLIDVLLRAVDTLRRQMAEALSERRPPAPEPALVQDLRAWLGSKAAASVPVPVHAANAGGAGEESETENGADLQQAVDVFMASARAILPQLLRDCLDASPLSAEAAQMAEDARAAGLLVVARLLEKMATDDVAARQAVLADLLSRLRHIESLSGQDAGTVSAYFILRRHYEPAFRQCLETAVTASATPLQVAADAQAWLQAVLPLRRFLQLLGLTAGQRLFALITQVLREVSRDALHPGEALAAQLGLAIGIAAELQDDLDEDVHYVAMTEQLLDNIQREVAALQDDADVLDASSPAALRAALDISDGMLAALSVSVRAQLAAHLAAGHVLAEIDADLESMADGGEAFVGWLSATGTQLANHTVFHGEGRDESTQLRFLAAFAAPEASVVTGLGLLDEDGLLALRVLRHPQHRNAAVLPVAPLMADAADGKAESSPAAPVRSNAATVRIDSSTLDSFVNRVGELVMLRNMMSHSFADERVNEGFRRLRQFLGGNSLPTPEEREQLVGMINMLAERRENLLQADARLQEALGHLQEDVLALRVVPVGSVFNRMTRVVWSLAQAQGKQVQVDIRGEETRIDKGMVDILAEPLSHMVRNAVDHGIESAEERRAAGKPAQAVLTLAASQQGNALLITVADDGRGLDLPRILAKARRLGLAGTQAYSDSDITSFIFAPGFSTTEQVTAVSGRGVGMDVVKTRIAQIGGQIDVRSQPGRGVTFTLRLPLSVAIQNVVLVEAGGRVLALPERQVNEVLQLPAASVQLVQGQAATLLRGVVLPLYGLDHLLGLATPTAAGTLDVVVFSDGRHRIGLVVARVIGRQEVFVRDLHADILRLPGVGGAAILGDGRVVIIADGDNLLELARRRAQGLQELLQGVHA
jgi:chemotaxis protein histidine kinase CheA